MAKGRKRRRAGGARSEPPRQLKLFHPISWYDRPVDSPYRDYIAHALQELGRLGLDIDDIERESRRVLSDLLRWHNDPGPALANLHDWTSLDVDLLRARMEREPDCLPRIEIYASITKRDNFIVRWYPSGWHDAPDSEQHGGFHPWNLIGRKEWARPPDFVWFEGDEELTFEKRPSNKLMYIRGVGLLDPQPREARSHYDVNQDVLDSILICAVQAAFDSLIRQLRRSFDVTLLQDFDFTVRDEPDPSDDIIKFDIHRVIA